MKIPNEDTILFLFLSSDNKDVGMFMIIIQELK